MKAAVGSFMPGTVVGSRPGGRHLDVIRGQAAELTAGAGLTQLVVGAICLIRLAAVQPPLRQAVHSPCEAERRCDELQEQINHAIVVKLWFRLFHVVLQCGFCGLRRTDRARGMASRVPFRPDGQGYQPRGESRAELADHHTL
jgi:hypothetical protein